jgi:hypothetical protein
MGFFLWLFWTDFTRTLVHMDSVPVGTITWKYKAAQRRFVDRVIWDRLQKESPLYNGDYIRTAELSEATITFAGGASISLAQSSMIQVFSGADALQVDVSAGDVSVDTSALSASANPAALVLNTGGRSISVAGGTILDARVAEGGDLNLSVSEGSAGLLTESGESRRIEAGEAIAMDPEGRTLDTPQTVIRSPKPIARFVNSGNPLPAVMPVEFVWDGMNYAAGDRTRIEFSQDRGFKRIARTQDGGRQGRARIELAPGVWYWRAYPAHDENGAAAAAVVTGRLTIVSVTPSRLLSPEEGYEFRYRSKAPSIRFQWTASPDIASYVLEAADNPGFSNPVLREPVRGGSGTSLSLTHSGLGNGRWYWRVTPMPEDEQGTVMEPSAAAAFTITQSGELTAPSPLSPPAEALISIADPRQDIYFSWQNEAEAGSYTLVVSTASDLRSPLITRQVTANYYAYTAAEPLLGEGRYYWGVSQTAVDGEVSAVSPVRSFTLQQWEPVLRPTFPPDTYTTTGARLRDTRFTWKTNISTPLRFQLSDTPDFSRFEINEAAAGGAFQGRLLSDGQWYWRIAAETGSLQTPVMSLRVLSALPAPVLTAPQSGRITVRQGAAAVTAFTWQSVDGADYYNFKLYAGNRARGTAIHSAAGITGNRLELPLRNYREGAYTWTIQAFVNAKAGSPRISSPAASAEFTLQIQQVRPIRLEYPPTGTEYAGLRARQQPDRVRWSSQDRAVNTRFILSRNANPLQGTPVMDIRNPPTSIPLIPLTEGTYYWTIQGQTDDGLNISAAAPSRFRVLPIPDETRSAPPETPRRSPQERPPETPRQSPQERLPEARNRLPENGYVLGIEQLRVSQVITFTWDAVPGANGYTFALYQEAESGRQLLKQWTSPQNSFVLDDLSILDNGSFIWQVEAVSLDANGSLEQRGIIGENHFIMNIPVIPRATANNPGKVYGQ